MKPLIIYHRNCQDGMAAAWVAHMHYGDTADYLACGYEDPAPDVAGREVYILDFSFKRPILEAMALVAKQITLIDHHESAEKDLTGAPLPDNVHVTFDMTKSGALLTWEHFFPDEETPEMIQHASDRDLWQFKLPGTKEICEYIFSLPYTFAAYHLAASLLKHKRDRVLETGASLLRAKLQACEAALKDGRNIRKIGDLYMPCINVPKTMGSECCHLMLENGSPVASYWYELADGRICFGLRSRTDSQINVADIAKEYGGGGHKHAAGFVTTSAITMPRRVNTKD